MSLEPGKTSEMEFVTKTVDAESLWLVLQKSPSWMFDGVLNTPLRSFILCNLKGVLRIKFLSL